MDIVIISEFTESFARDDNDRFLYLARMLAEEHEVELVTGSFRHSTKSRRTEPADPWPFRITFLEEPGYPRNICLQRFRSHREWGRNVLDYLKSRKKPDAVWCAVPSLTGPRLVGKYCEKNRIRFIIDVQDLWPEAFRMALNIPGLSKAIFAPFACLANGIYRRADAVCAVSESYRARALRVNRKTTEGCAVYLGVELEAFDRCAAAHPLSGKPYRRKEGEILLGYAGTLGTSYDLPVVFEAMRKLGRPEVRMIVVGDGPLAESFRQKAEGLKVTFTGRLPWEEMCGVMKGCDMVVNPIIGTSVATIINKHGDYAACGRPVLNTQASDEYRTLVEEYRMGFNCRPGDAAELAEKIEKLMNDPALREEMGRNARRCAEEKFDRAATYPRFFAVLRAAEDSAQRSECRVES